MKYLILSMAIFGLTMAQAEVRDSADVQRLADEAKQTLAAAQERLRCPPITESKRATLTKQRGLLKTDLEAVEVALSDLEAQARQRMTQLEGDHPVQKSNRYALAEEFAAKRVKLRAQREAIGAALAALPKALYANACGEQLASVVARPVVSSAPKAARAPKRTKAERARLDPVVAELLAPVEPVASP